MENWESFYTLGYVNPPCPLIALYLGGQPAEVLLDALSQLIPPPAVALHFGDYDWSGLQIFNRLRRVLPSIQLYVPDNLEELFQQFSKRSLVDSQSLSLLDDVSEVIMVANLISQFNAGLEQEIVLPPPIESFSVKSSGSY